MKTISCLKYVPIFLMMLSCNPEIDKMLVNNFEKILISKGSLYGHGTEGLSQENLIIENNEQWDTLKQQMDIGNNVSSGFAETEIDFSEYVILACFDKVQSLNSYSIDLNINQGNNQINVDVIYTSESEIGSTVETQPYIIVKISSTGLPIVFN